MTTFEIPSVATARVRLRAFRAADLDAYTAMQANPEVMRYLVMGRTSTRVEVWRTMATSLGSWLLRGYGMWACEKIDDGAFIGSVGIFEPLDWPEPEIAYSVDQPYWGQGLATEAARAARDWLFEHFPMTRAASFIRPDNHASKRVAQKLGAVCERKFELRGAPYEWWVHHRTGEHPHSPLEQMQITIRAYEERDLDGIARLWFESWRSTGLAVAQQATETAMRARIPVELASGWKVFVGIDAGNQLVGLLAIKPDVGQLDQIFVAPNAQRQGIGRALLDLAKREMTGAIWLRTAVDNVRACRFYERFGFRRGETDVHPTLGHRTVIYHWP
jgi:RimJ/RimL family protein N-acetyltransferase